MKTAWTTAVAIALSVVCAPAGAQSLVDAAKRAEEKRKSGPATGVTFDERDVNPQISAREVLGYQIDEQRWKVFVTADHRVMDAIEKDATLYSRLEMLRANSARMIERFLLREPTLLKTLKASGTDAREYAYTSVAIGFAMAIIASNPGPEIFEQLPDATKANVAFVRAHEAEIKPLLARGERLRDSAVKARGADRPAEAGPDPGGAVLTRKTPVRGAAAYELDEVRWRRFVAADRLVAGVFERDPALYARIAQPLDAEDGERLVGLILAEPAVVKALLAADTSPHEYAHTSLAITLAAMMAFDNPSRALVEQATPAVKANVAFVRAHEREVRDQIARNRALAARMGKK
jgi:hypothetical protein